MGKARDRAGLRPVGPDHVLSLALSCPAHYCVCELLMSPLLLSVLPNSNVP